MGLKQGDSAFELLACLYSFLSLEEERRCGILLATIKEGGIKLIIERYKKIPEIVMAAAGNEYRFSELEIDQINALLAALQQENRQDEIYLLIIRVEECIDMYSNWCTSVICKLEPLNSNYVETGVSIYPHYKPQWNISKSEYYRSNTINPKLKNYIMIRQKDCTPFTVIMHYWDEEGLLERTKTGWKLKIALSPVSSHAELDTEKVNFGEQSGTVVKGLKNAEEIENRVVTIFQELFDKEYRIIVFPEALGTPTLVTKIQHIMRNEPQRIVLVILPSVCGEGKNTLTVLGPGGVHILEENKQTPFILEDTDGEKTREVLEYEDRIHILITKELGNLVFPICAEFLEPEYYNLITNVGMANTIICSSFSPGNEAFRSQLIKGISIKSFGLWVNTCSAEKVSRRKRIPEPLFAVQLPDAKPEEPLTYVERVCGGICTEEKCYVDIEVIYSSDHFKVNCMKYQCA